MNAHYLNRFLPLAVMIYLTTAVPEGVRGVDIGMTLKSLLKTDLLFVVAYDTSDGEAVRGTGLFLWNYVDSGAVYLLTATHCVQE